MSVEHRKAANALMDVKNYISYTPLWNLDELHRRVTIAIEARDIYEASKDKEKTQ